MVRRIDIACAAACFRTASKLIPESTESDRSRPHPQWSVASPLACRPMRASIPRTGFPGESTFAADWVASTLRARFGQAWPRHGLADRSMGERANLVDAAGCTARNRKPGRPRREWSCAPSVGSRRSRRTLFRVRRKDHVHSVLSWVTPASPRGARCPTVDRWAVRRRAIASAPQVS